MYLLHANRDTISVMLGRAVASGVDVDDAVVVIVDQQDPLGREFAEAAAEKAGLDAREEAARVERSGEIPTAVIVVNVQAARLLFRETHPTVSSGLPRQPEPGRVRVVVIAEGAALLVHAEVSLPGQFVEA